MVQHLQCLKDNKKFGNRYVTPEGDCHHKHRPQPEQGVRLSVACHYQRVGQHQHNINHRLVEELMMSVVTVEVDHQKC